MIPYADPSLNATRAGKAAQLARSFSSVLAWTFGAILFLPLVGGLLTFVFWQPFFGGIGAAVVLVVTVVAGSSLRQLRRRRSRVILSYLLQAIQLKLPITAMLDAASAGESRAIANRLLRLRAALEDGASVGNALQLAIPHTPTRTVDLLNAAERNGCLESVLRRLSDEPTATQSSLELPAFVQIYGLLLFGIVAALIVLIDTFVMPKFQQIANDFKIALPPLTRSVIGFGEMVAPLITVICAVAVMMNAGNAMRQLLSPAKPQKNLLRFLTDRLIWFAPIAGSIAQSRGMADALGVMANALEAGRSADQAIQEAMMPHLNAVLRHQIEAWSLRLGGGANLHDGASAAGMPSLVVNLLASGEKSGNVPATMRFLARYYAFRFSRAALLIRAAAAPALALIAGALVLITAASIFGPLIQLINGVSATRKPW